MQDDDAVMRCRVRGSGSGVWGRAWLLLLGALLTAFAPQPAWAAVTFTQITNTISSNPYDFNYGPSINADGTRIAFTSNRDLTGDNPDGSLEIFLWTSGTGITQITSSTGGGGNYGSINADGTRIAFTSESDLTGSNPDHNIEIFLWTSGTSGTGITQVTNTTGGGNVSPPINADGTRIAFDSTSDLLPASSLLTQERGSV
jgi:Tol biopolymer transport system component